MDLKFPWLRVSPERQEVVIREIDYGCQPGGRFYALVATSTLIACLGLIGNSTAVVIGAMLVAPLMTPIFGISLSLVRGEALMLGRAIRAEIMGVVLAVGIAALFGSLPMALEVTPEMLARTRPNLLDLLVAVLAGFAGAYAMTNERLSPALPGVAIATAIVPPLANVGLCLAVGAYQGAYGSFLLFLANFLSILVVSSLVFIAAGLVRAVPIERWGFVRRFGVPGLGFLVVAVLLTQPLVHIVKDRYLTSAIKKVISATISPIAHHGDVQDEPRRARGQALYSGHGADSPGDPALSRQSHPGRLEQHPQDAHATDHQVHPEQRCQRLRHHQRSG